MRKAMVAALAVGVSALAFGSRPGYLAAKGAREFHRVNCPVTKKIDLNQASGFGTRQQAIDAGLKPCPICKP
jgi:hypothetical protein